MLGDDEDHLGELAEEVLAEHGPATIPELVEALERDGYDLGPEAEEDLADALSESPDGGAVPLLDGRWAYAPTLLDGRVLTHRLTAGEVEHDVLTVHPDLLPVLSGDLRLVDGGDLSLVFPTELSGRPPPRELPPDAIDLHGSLVLPPGLLSGLGAAEGRLVGLVMTEVGIHLQRIDRSELTGDPRPVQEELRNLVRVSPDEPVDLDPALWTLCANQADAFRGPLLPLSELFAGAGVAHHGDQIAPAGFDFHRYRSKQHVAELGEDYDLTEDEALALAGLLKVYHDMAVVLAAARLPGDDDGDEEDGTVAEISRPADPTHAEMIAAIVPFLTEPAVAYAFLAETIEHDSAGAAAVGLMAETLEQQSVRSVRHPLLWLRAKACDRLGMVEEAEVCLRAAERLDPAWYPTLVDLARYASDRGDAARGLDLLRRVGDNADPRLQELLESFRPRPGPTVGRNEPCWCGSGRKFKQCHLHRPAAHPLAERARWLYAKAVSFLEDGPWLGLRVTVAAERAAYAEGEDEVERAISDPLVNDAVLFEGGGFADFLRMRGPLLPDDERLLGEQWLLVDRSVFEVTEVRRGHGFSARDLRTGDMHVLQDRLASTSLRPGQLICARIVPAGETHQVFGGAEPVGLSERDALLALLDSTPEPEELVAFLTRRFAPPSLTNTEGDPLVLNEAVLEVTDVATLTAALDGAYRRLEHTSGPEWIEERSIEGFDRVRVTLRLSDGELRVSTNSDARMHDVLARVTELQQGMRVLRRERTPMPTTREAGRLARERSAGTAVPPPLDQQAPEVQEALGRYIADYERKWLDLSIPALHGLTPREAAEDPTRREDLLSLLASFPDQDSPTAMSANRLRTALGLTS